MQYLYRVAVRFWLLSFLPPSHICQASPKNGGKHISQPIFCWLANSFITTSVSPFLPSLFLFTRLYVNNTHICGRWCQAFENVKNSWMCFFFWVVQRRRRRSYSRAHSSFNALSSAIRKDKTPLHSMNAEKNIMHEIISRAHCFFLFSHVQQTVGFFSVCLQSCSALSSLLWPLISSCEIPQQ